LSDAGEAIELLEPDTPQGPLDPDPGFVPYVQVERIKYSSGAPWPADAANSGDSLQRSVALNFGNEPLNWVSSSPTAGRVNVLDSDGDGMPDAWEDEHELDRNSAADAELDSDGDGAANLHEYQAGTDPNVASSAFAFKSITRQGNGVRLRFHGVQGRAYSIEIRGSISQGSWQSVSNLTVVSATGEKEVLIPGQTNAMQFFRMSTPVTP
jgi:hypothetical protein